MTHSHYKVRRKSIRWKPIGAVAIAIVIVVAIGADFMMGRRGRRVSGFAMAGGPVVITSAENPLVVGLSSHFEYTRLPQGRSVTRAPETSELHWDLWGFNGSDLSRRWVTRLATIERGQRNLQAAILGVSNGVAWLLADGLMAVSIEDGHVIGDAAMIESRNSALLGKMPTARSQILFDDGLILIAADGQRFRIDGTTLLASDVTNTPSNTIAEVYRPLSIASQYQNFKLRSIVVGDTWFGMMNSSEVDMFNGGDRREQDFGQSLRYGLWRAPLRDTVNRFRDQVRVPSNYAPLPASPEFLRGGLLSVVDGEKRQRVIGIPDPTRLIVLHQDRIDNAGTQTLSCIDLKGNVCWTAPLEMSIASGFAMLSRGRPSEWALIVVGIDSRAPADDSNGDYMSLARVDVNNGAVKRMAFSSINLADLSDELKPFHKR